MISILSDTIEGDKRIIIYTTDGVNESHRVTTSAYEQTPQEPLPIPKSPFEIMEDRLAALEALEIQRMLGGMGL